MTVHATAPLPATETKLVHDLVDALRRHGVQGAPVALGAKDGSGITFFRMKTGEGFRRKLVDLMVEFYSTTTKLPANDECPGGRIGIAEIGFDEELDHCLEFDFKEGEDRCVVIMPRTLLLDGMCTHSRNHYLEEIEFFVDFLEDRAPS